MDATARGTRYAGDHLPYPYSGRTIAESWVERRRVGVYERVGKRLLDVVVAVLVFAVASPLLVGGALAVYLTMGRPVFLRQTRVGRDGRLFTVYKLRTMKPDRRVRERTFLGADQRKVHKSPHDPRITRIGRMLRKTSIDELPQLANVLEGEMSMVGPRPELPQIVDDYESWQHLRHGVKPGITGLWQVTERDSGVLMHHRTDIDLEYVAQISFAMDVRILAQTVPAVLERGVRSKG